MPPQTAAQINAPQTGETTFVPGTAPKTAAPTKKPAVSASKPQNWSISNLYGTKQFVKDKIDARTDIEPHWRNCLCEVLNSDLLASFNVVSIDAHIQVHDGKTKGTPPVILLTLRISPENVGGI